MVKEYKIISTQEEFHDLPYENFEFIGYQFNFKPKSIIDDFYKFNGCAFNDIIFYSCKFNSCIFDGFTFEELLGQVNFEFTNSYLDAKLIVQNRLYFGDKCEIR